MDKPAPINIEDNTAGQFWFVGTEKKDVFEVGYSNQECFQIVGRTVARRLVRAMNEILKTERE